MKNEKMFKEWMSLFGEMFDKEISDLLKNAYWKVFQPFTDEQCKEAFGKVFITVKFFPKPADFMDHLLPKRFDEIDFHTNAYLLYGSPEWKERYPDG